MKREAAWWARALALSWLSMLGVSVAREASAGAQELPREYVRAQGLRRTVRLYRPTRSRWW